MKKFLRISSSLLFLVIAFLPEKMHGAYPLGTELIYYKFEDAATATSTNSGSGGTTYDGTLVGNASTSALQKRFGSRSAVFGEASDYMRTYFAGSPALNPTTSSVSVSFWIYKGTNSCTADDDHVFGTGNTTANLRFYIRCRNATTNKWSYRIHTNANADSAATVSTAAWDHIALVANAATDQATFYVNNATTSATYGSYTIPGEFFFGNYNDMSVTQDRGAGAGAYIDEAAIYNVALTAAEVASLYKAGDGVAPVISAIATSSVTSTGATIAWTTDENASTQIEYGTTGSWGSYTTLTDNTTYVTSHSQSITGLSPGTTYHYRVASLDPIGTAASSTSSTFTTTGSAAPTITNVSSDKANGYYAEGAVIDIDLTFSEAVTATTSVTVTLETGTTDRTCAFTVSNSTTATCNYTVQAGDISSDLTVSSVSGYIESQTAVRVTNFTPSTNLATNKAIVIGEYISFVSPTIAANSTTTSSSITAYASSTIQTTATNTTAYLSITTPAGAGISTVSTTTRYGDYNLVHLTNVISASNLSLTANTSGIAYVATSSDPGSLFTVHNSSNVISEISVTGALLRTITCSSCGDIEGITLISSIASTTALGVFDYTFMISTEDTLASGKIFRVVIPSTGAVTVTNTDSFNTGIAHEFNTGLEGIAYNSTSGVFYLAEEKAAPTLYEYPLNGTAVQICGNLDFTSIATDFSDLAYKNSILYVLSDENSRLIPVNITSTSTCAFVDSDGDGNTTNDTGDYLNSIPFTVGGPDDQAEGVTWDNTGDYLYIVGEDDDFNRYRTNAFTHRHTFTGLSNGSYILSASSTDVTTGLITHSPTRNFGIDNDVTAPTVTNVSSDKANGSYKAGEIIDIDVTFSEAVTSTGNVTVTLETGATDRTCTFTVSSSTTGTCNYTVEAGDSSSDLTVSTAGITGTVKDAALNTMTSPATPATNLAANKALVIDTTAPTITNVTSDKANGTYGVGEVIDIDVTFSEAVTSTGNVTVTLETGDTDRTCTFTVSNTTTGTCNYTLLNGDTSSDLTISSAGISGTVADAAANAMTSPATPATNLAANKSLVIDTSASTISALDATVTSTSATITWTTSEAASSRVAYGVSSTYSATTTEADTSPRVTNHSVALTSLQSCTVYYYRAASTDSVSNIAYSADATFTTSGCTGSADVETTEVESITVASGGDVTVTSGDQSLKLDIPAAVTGSAATLIFQAKILTDTSVITSIGSPTGQTIAAGQIYDLKAFSDATTLVTAFDEAITITITYSDADIASLDESSLQIWRYNGTAWVAL